MKRTRFTRKDSRRVWTTLEVIPQTPYNASEEVMLTMQQIREDRAKNNLLFSMKNNLVKKGESVWS